MHRRTFGERQLGRLSLHASMVRVPSAVSLGLVYAELVSRRPGTARGYLLCSSAEPKVPSSRGSYERTSQHRRGNVSGALSRARSGRTLFLTARRLSTIQDYDTVRVVAEGTVVELGRHEVLLMKGGMYSSGTRQHTLSQAIRGLRVRSVCCAVAGTVPPTGIGTKRVSVSW